MKRTRDTHRKPTISVDFDGVIHRYSKGWHHGTIYDIPMPGVKAALKTLQKKFRIVVFSRRAAYQGVAPLKTWLLKHKIPFDAVTKIKPRARWYIDDRAIHFTTWRKTLKELARRERHYPFAHRK